MYFCIDILTFEYYYHMIRNFEEEFRLTMRLDGASLSDFKKFIKSRYIRLYISDIKKRHYLLEYCFKMNILNFYRKLVNNCVCLPYFLLEGLSNTSMEKIYTMLVDDLYYYIKHVKFNNRVVNVDKGMIYDSIKKHQLLSFIRNEYSINYSEFAEIQRKYIYKL